MTKGYLILAQNNKDDYVKMAYVAAMSIKLTQKEINNVTLVTDVPDAVPEHYKKVFDQILPILWYDDALDSDWKIENRWKLYHMTPYDETVVIDADMLFLSDVSHWWKYLTENHEMMITDKVFTYRNELITTSRYRKAFIDNSLPNCYSAFTYFKKCDLAKMFWKIVEVIVKDWQVFYQKYIKESRPGHLSIDIVFSLAVKILGIEDQVFSSFDYPSFIHMKSYDQNWKNASPDWTEHAGIYMNEQCQLKIGNYQQTGIFHYTEKKFLNNDITMKYEKLIGVYNEN